MYDIADLYKAEVTIPIAFEVAAQAPEDLPAVVRRRVRDAMVEHHILERMVHDIRWLLLTQLDGYLTGILVSPDLVPPGSWLKHIWAGDDGEGAWFGDSRGRSRAPTNYWSLVGLFAMMAAGFGVAAFLGVDNGSGAFVIVALTMAAVAVWALICAVTQKREERL